MMPVRRKYRVVLSQHANIVVDVKATSPAEAKELAEADAYAGLCHQCSHSIDLDPDNWDAIDEDPELVDDIEARIVDAEVIDEPATPAVALAKLLRNWPAGGPW